MKIESLSINNFRQFCGEVTLELSTDPDKNVTVVHGANGSGKTSLLNAFKWCFYGQTDFDTLNENILNEAAIQSVPEEGGVIDLSIVLYVNILVRISGASRIDGAARSVTKVLGCEVRHFIHSFMKSINYF